MRELRTLDSGDDKLFTLEELVAALGAEGPEALPSDVDVRGVCVDSRAVRPGDLFVALRGSSFDGHYYLRDALERGAVAALVSSGSPVSLPGSLPAIRVEDTLDALGQVGAWHASRFDIPVVAVTGSVGKTTTKDMVSGVLDHRGPILKNPGNFNTEIGTPLTLLSLGSRHRGLVQEIGMRKPGDVRYLADMLAADVGVFTNVRESHLEFFGTVENLADSKSELFTRLRGSGWAIANGDDPYGEYMLAKSDARGLLYYASGKPGDQRERSLWATGVRLDERARASFELNLPDGESTSVFLPLPGEHHVANALAAAAVGYALGSNPDQIARGLSAFVPTEMRTQWLQCGRVMLLNDAYNSSPTSCMAALRTLGVGAPCDSRKVAVLGPMLELGPMEEEGHRSVGRFLPETGVELLITVGSPTQLIGEEVRRFDGSSIATRHFEDLEGLLEVIGEMLHPGDTVLVKASRSCQFERFVSAVCNIFGFPENGGV